ncbi:hypothetical protein I4U23_029432 [Adineta vaga]|nr:hypothetical protein I4U23_029432 [Adineta vaga]
MTTSEDSRRHGSCIKFLSDFRALFIKAFFLTIRKPSQTIAEILLAYTFLGFLLGMRYILDRRYFGPYRMSRFRPQDTLLSNDTGNTIYYYPGNICATTIVTNAVNNLIAARPAFPSTIQVMPDPTLSSASNATLSSIFAYIYFTNINSCSSPSTMPDEVSYTLRMQENGPFYYQAQTTKISENDYLWKRAPENFCQERENKTKEYLRIYGLRTWINNMVWVTRSMIIYFVLTSVVTGFSMLVLPRSNNSRNSVSKALFNCTHWTVIWTILFVYSIQVSTFSVLFGQFFKRPLLAKLIGFVVWVITFIDFYPGVSVGEITTFNQFYSNLFPYPLYIGVCLLLMLIYSVIYLLLAIYVERVNPGEFGVSQSWNYLFKRSYWTPHATSTVQPLANNDHHHANGGVMSGKDCWFEMNQKMNMKSPSLTVSHLTKKYGKFCAVSDLSLEFYSGEVCSLLGHNGAGKTTTTFILVGMLEATSGDVMVEGLDTRQHIQDVRKILGFCPQYDILYNELSVKEHLELVGKMRHMKPKLMAESIDTILHLIGLDNDKDTFSKNLSGGMKRRLSIGISLMGDPKVLILDEPTSGIDPYNRRLIWTMIRKMKEAGKCIILTTHFLEEADVLSDRIAIMTSGRLQASGTPDFLKSQTEFEYRLFIDKQETCANERVVGFIQRFIPKIVVERESSSEMVFGIRRSESKQIGQLIHALDEERLNIGVESYGLSMTTIEEVFLKLIREAEKEEENSNLSILSDNHLADKVLALVFHTEHQRYTGGKRFWLRIAALLIKRWQVLRRQYVFILGFFVFPIIIEILTSCERCTIALLPSIYNPQTIVTYANKNGNNAQTRLINYLQTAGATIDQISSDTVLNYVRDRYLLTEDAFINTYQLGFALYNNLTSATASLTMNSYFSTVNYHTMPVSLSVASTSLFQFYTNSSAKKIITTNQPILTTAKSYTFQARFFEIIYCFDTLPLSLFNFINSIAASVFISTLIVPLIQERITHSKDLQLLTNLTKRSYWFSNIIFDLCLCLILCTFLTIIVKIGAVANSNIQSEVHGYVNSEHISYFFLMILMYSLASLPMIYVYSFGPKSELIGFIIFFVINVVVCFCDMIFDFISVFSQASATGATSLTKLSEVMNNLAWILVVLFPSVNFKHSLFNIRLKSNQDCISALNSIMFTDYSSTESWMSLRAPGLGIMFIIFCVQIIFWWSILTLIENKTNIALGCRRCCLSKNNLATIHIVNQSNNQKNSNPTSLTGPNYWNDTHLDDDVRNERQAVLQESSSSYSPSSSSSVVLERDLEIGFCPQFDWLVNDLTVTETLTLFARLKGLQWSEIPQICSDMIDLFGLEKYRKRRVQKLSGGNKRKVSAALAFMANPALVFLDEPTTGLDAAAKRKLWNVIRAARDIGLTIILTSHSMEECEALCTKIGIMKLGQFMCLGNLQRLKNRFGNGYAVQVKLALQDISRFKEELMLTLPGVEIDEQHNGMLFCTIPFSTSNRTENVTEKVFMSLSGIFEWFNEQKEAKLIESYSITQTTLEQIFIHLACEDEEIHTNSTKKK